MADPRGARVADPDVIFLAEAFTRPKMMKALAKLGFTQSYTYFTWRTDKEELQDYLSELTGYPEREYFRPNFFVNTPDILPVHLQTGEPWMFKSRVALAATLSSNYGIYNGFELLEHEPIPGREEYLNSEKYEIKVRDWDKPGNIKDYICQRSTASAATTRRCCRPPTCAFCRSTTTTSSASSRNSADGDNAVAVAISLTGAPRTNSGCISATADRPADAKRGRSASIENLVTGERHLLEWGGVRLRIDPSNDPALLFRCTA